jgi:hypothetical protein
MTSGEIVDLTFNEADGDATITFDTGGTDNRKCSLWEASEWAGAAGLTIVSATIDTYRWERLIGPIDSSES